MIREFCKLLHKELSSKIKGRVIIYHDLDDMDEITIVIENHNLIFTTQLDKISETILRGYSVHTQAMVIVEKYKSYLLSRFFYK